jgi:hypothetical protein
MLKDVEKVIRVTKNGWNAIGDNVALGGVLEK